MKEEPERSFAEQYAQANNVVGWVFQSIAFTVIVFLRRRFGERYIGLQGLIAVPLILVYSMLWPHHDIRPLLLFLVLYLILCFFARIGVRWRRWRGVISHSRYDGTPRLMRLLPRVSEIKVKRVIEPMLVCLTGVLLLPTNQPLGFYLMLASFALFGCTQVQQAVDRTKLLNLNDAMIEQQESSERFRAMNGKYR